MLVRLYNENPNPRDVRNVVDVLREGGVIADGYDDELDELTITQHDPNAIPIMLLGFSHPEISDMDELRGIAESYLRNELIRLEGVADVRLLGQEEKEVVVEEEETDEPAEPEVISKSKKDDEEGDSDKEKES